MTRDPEAGLTLIEMLVVLTIIAIASGVSVMGLGALDRGARTEDEAMRLADRLQLASDRALVSGAPLSLVWDARGYQFLSWDAANRTWAPPRDRLLSSPHRLPGTLVLQQPGAPIYHPLLISPDRGLPTAILEIAGGVASWTVRFDGLAVVAAPKGGPNG